VAELTETIWRFRERSSATRVVRRRERGEHRLRELLSRRFMEHLDRHVLAAGELASLLDRIAARELDPYTAAADLMTRALAGNR
jgi:putative protein kinase ArgK-like GTPase of G3E family